MENQKVYLVWQYELHEGKELIKIFNTLEKAINKAKECANKLHLPPSDEIWCWSIEIDEEIVE